jgi:ABC-type transport system substrate-binding protein
MNQENSLLTLILILLLSSTMIIPLGMVSGQDDAIFKITVIAPGNANMVRRQWGQIFVNSLKQLGIDARIVYLGWTGVFDRVIAPPLTIRGLTWDEGGFDSLLVGRTPGLNPAPHELYYGANMSWAPYGGNIYLYNSSAANDAMDTYLTTTNFTEQEAAGMELQQILYKDVPNSMIMFTATPFVVTPELEGVGLNDTITGSGGAWVYSNDHPYPELLKGKTSVVYASTGEIVDLIGPLSYSWYDTIIYQPISERLARPLPNMSDLSAPALLTSWTPSNNGYKWTFECRTGVKWHDGEDFTADDVVFTLWALMNTETGSKHVGKNLDAFGNNVTFTYSNTSSVTLVSGEGDRVGNITAIDSDTVEAWLPDFAGGKPYGYMDPYLMTYLSHTVIPKHILELVPPADWATSPFNTGIGSIDVGGTTYTGPVGTGPYKWVDYDAVNQIVHLEKNDQYWDKANLEAAGLFEVEDYYIRFIVDKTSALAALKNDDVDMLDPQYQMQLDVPTIDSSWGKVFEQSGTGTQEIVYNMQHPIWGTGEDTPLGQSNASRAEEAARYVRTAFDYAVPRQLIIDNLVAGYGEPAATFWAPTHPYYNSTITARPYDLTKAAEYLEMAGYTVPAQPAPAVAEFFVGMSVSIGGTHTDETTGGILPEAEIELRQTTDNVTFEVVGLTTTDYSGRYFFTVSPTEAGTYYYWIFDREYAAVDEQYNGTYIRSLTVTTFSSTMDGILDPIVESLQTQLQNLMIIASVALILDPRNSV